MKKLSKEAKFNLRTGFGTLVSNQSCIEAGKSLPWWTAIIIGLIGTFIPVIPVMVNISKSNGQNFISNISNTYNYSFDRNSAIMNLQMKNEGIELIVEDYNYLSFYKDGEKQNPTKPVLLSSYINSESHQYDMMAYWLVDTSEKTINDHFNSIIATQYRVGTTTQKVTDTEGSFYTPSYLFYYSDGNALYLAKANTTSAASKFAGDFKNTPVGTKLVERLLTVEGYEIPATINDMDTDYIQGVYKNYKNFYNESYLDTKSKSLIYSTFIYWSIYIGLTLFLGLLIFLLTRGKRNFNNYLKWYQCLSISGWASFSPGVLAMILGFFMANYAIMFFILFMGVRAMWLSMKQLSPAYQGQAK